MKQISPVLLSLLLLPMINSVQAQVYETTDDQGNKVFTDEPPTAESRPLELGSPNIADSVEEPPPEPREEPPAERQAQPGNPAVETPVYVGGDDDLRDDLDEERRRREVKEHLPGHEEPVARPAPAPRAAPHPGRR